MSEPLLPAPLAPGDTIGIIAPAGRLKDQRAFEAGLRILSEMGFELRFPRDLWPGTDYLADSDRNRAAEFNRAWADPDIAAILALRGGYGCLRMLEGIDCDLVRARPKWLIGYSDLTVLHSFLFARTGIQTLHGPDLCTLERLSKESLTCFFQSLAGRVRNLNPRGIEILRGQGPVQGRLAGGNLCSLLTLFATPLEPDWRDRILFLEETGEPLYRIDRMLTQLALTGKLADLAGLIIGDFSLGPEQDAIERIRHHESVWQRVLELTGNGGYPIWGNFPVGHGQENLSLPHGALVEMDSARAELRFLSPA